jgi:glycine cleavage system H protein
MAEPVPTTAQQSAVHPYRRSRFSTRLPLGRLYTPSHAWLMEEEPGLWRVGLTRFAIRMLGDLVEFEFDAKPGEAVAVGQPIGRIEGFKALSDIYCVAEGEFAGGNPELAGDITLADTDHYGRGWLYRVRGRPDPRSVDVGGYVAVLDLTIDTMLKQAGGRDAAAADDEGAEDADAQERICER